MHTVTSGESGTTYNTAGPGEGITYSSGTGMLDIMGSIDALHYYDPLNGLCPTDAGSDCAFNFGPNLNLEVHASYVDMVVTPVGGGFFTIDIEFESTGGVDIMWTDPTDSDSVQLAAMWTGGTFLGQPTTGLMASTVYDSNTETVVAPISVVGFAVLDPLTPFAGLFGTGTPGDQQIQLDITTFVDLDVSQLIADSFAQGSLTDFTASIDGGQIFRVASGDFVIPEPTTGVLVGLGLAGMAAMRRREER
jgi:hypothetical protein